MKKIFAMLILCILMLTSCSIENRNDFMFKDNEEIANNIFQQIVDSIDMHDSQKLQEIFSENVRSNVSDIQEKADEFLEYVNGDVVSFTKAAPEGEVTVSGGAEIRNGKKNKHIRSSFTIETTEYTYYVAVKAYTRDDFDADNVGLSSLYIVESSKWSVDYKYWGDNEWTPGINIEVLNLRTEDPWDDM